MMFKEQTLRRFLLIFTLLARGSFQEFLCPPVQEEERRLDEFLQCEKCLKQAIEYYACFCCAETIENFYEEREEDEEEGFKFENPGHFEKSMILPKLLKCSFCHCSPTIKNIFPTNLCPECYLKLLENRGTGPCDKRTCCETDGKPKTFSIDLSTDASPGPIAT